MTIHFLGFTLYEFDVAVTDFLLFIETIIFAIWLYKKSSPKQLLQWLLIAFFTSLAFSSLLGAVFHGFFPAKATTTEGFVVWILIAAAIGLTAATMLLLNAFILGEQRLVSQARPWVALYFFFYILIVIFFNHEFRTIILFYLPPMIWLAFNGVIQFFKTRQGKWLGMLFSIVLSFVAAAIQALHINLHPVYFNYNALYHVVQAIALVIIFRISYFVLFEEVNL